MPSHAENNGALRLARNASSEAMFTRVFGSVEELQGLKRLRKKSATAW